MLQQQPNAAGILSSCKEETLLDASHVNSIAGVMML
jgi:hypothetical protein